MTGLPLLVQVRLHILNTSCRMMICEIRTREASVLCSDRKCPVAFEPICIKDTLAASPSLLHWERDRHERILVA